MIPTFKNFPVIKLNPIATSNIAREIIHSLGDNIPKHNLLTVDIPMTSAGLVLGKNFKNPK
jgi:hypothetical protein